MSAISTILARLRSAIWAIDVRDDIADAIEQCYSDVSNPTLQTDALEAAIQEKIDEGEMAALTIGDGTITAAKLAANAVTTPKIADGSITQAKLDPNIDFVQVDDTLSQTGEAADAAAVGAAIDELNGSLEDLRTAPTIKIAESISDMIDTYALYLYNGSEAGYNKGGLYYYTGKQWIQTDTINDPELPVLNLMGSFDGVSKDNKVTMGYVYTNGNDKKTGWCTVKVQGQTSAIWAKHNWKIQFYKDPYLKNKDKINFGFGKQSKYTFKSNYNDFSMARNVISAEIWGDIVKTRKSYPKGLSDTPNHGAVDGFPCLLYLNGSFYGLYSWNVDKDWMTDVDDTNELNALISASQQLGSARFLSDTNDSWECEIPDVFPAQAETALINLLGFVINSTDEEFVSNIDDYVDLESVIDYIIYTWFIGATDNLGKNIYLITYDSVKWYMTAYDLDATFGNHWYGGLTIPYNTPFPKNSSVTGSAYQITDNRLFLRTIALFPTEIVARYNYLRKTVLSLEYVKNKFHAFMSKIPESAWKKDVQRWNTRASSPTGALSEAYIINWITNRAAYVDQDLRSLDPNYIPCTGISITPSSITFSTLEDRELTATLSPTGCAEEVVWSTSDDDVVSVDTNGIITPHDSGSAVITATCGSYSATCNVTVPDEILIWSDTAGYRGNSDGTYSYDQSVSSYDRYMTTRDVLLEEGFNYSISWNRDYSDCIVYDQNNNPMRASSNVLYSNSPMAITTLKEADGLIPTKLKIFTIHPSELTLSKSSGTWSTEAFHVVAVTGEYINKWRRSRMADKTGTTSWTEYVLMSPIEVAYGEQWKVVGREPRFTFYDSNGGFVRTLRYGNVNEKTVDVPENAAYMIVSTNSERSTANNTITKVE